MHHESLGIYIYAKPKNQRERDYNDRMREKAEALRCRRFESIVNERYDFFDKEKMKATIKQEQCQTRLSIAEHEWLRA
jgi:hypothetical protein